MGRAPASATPTAVAIRDGTSIGSRIGSSGTKKTPSGKASAAAEASCSDSRVLPVPPGPVRVSNRVVARSRAASSSSAARPTNVVSWVGRLFGRASGRAQRREVGRKVVGLDLDDVLGAEQVLEPVRPEVAQPELGRQVSLDQPSGRV